MLITVDEEKCIGAGQCVVVADEVFDQREDDGVVVLLDPAPGPELHDAARSAAAVCPALAIVIEEGAPS